MKKRLFATVLTGVLVSLVGGAAVGAHAQTVSASGCDIISSWTFSPPLSTTMVTNGSASFNYTVTCAVVDSSTGLPTTYSTTGAVQSSYNGNCALAFLFDTAGRNGVILGGVNTTYVLPFPSTFVLTPTDPCNDSGPTPAIGVSTVAAVTP